MSTRALAARALAAAGALAVLAGCAGGPRWPARPSPETIPQMSPLHSRTLGQGDAWLRHYLMEGKADSAAALLERRDLGPRDDLLRQLQMGLVLHAAGRYAESNVAFEVAEAEGERRYGRSVSQTVGALLLNDGVADYVPSRPELAMIPYYRMLNYLALGERDGAVVEARKAGAYLERLGQGGKQPCVGEGMVLYVTGLVQRSAGERGDALVSFRQAERAFDACSGRDAAAAPPGLGEELFRTARAVGVGEVADSARRRYRIGALPAEPGRGTGELVVLVEQGWVAHRAEADAEFVLYPSDVSGVDDDDNESLWTAATQVSARLTAHVNRTAVERTASVSSSPALWPERWHGGRIGRSDYVYGGGGDDADGLYVLRLAWPEIRLEACTAPRVRVVVGDSASGEPVVEEAPVVGDVSSGVASAFASARAAILTRMVARGITKYMVVRGVGRKAEKEGGEAAGWLARFVANLGANALERADTRSWSLLPDRVGVVRFALPAGEHTVRVESLNPDGSVEDTLELGRVTISEGGTVFRSQRVWGMEMGSLRAGEDLGK